MIVLMHVVPRPNMDPPVKDSSLFQLMAEDSGGRAKGEEEMEMVDFPWDFGFIRILESNTFTVMTCDDFVLVVQKQHFNAL